MVDKLGLTVNRVLNSSGRFTKFADGLDQKANELGPQNPDYYNLLVLSAAFNVAARKLVAVIDDLEYIRNNFDISVPPPPPVD